MAKINILSLEEQLKQTHLPYKRDISPIRGGVSVEYTLTDQGIILDLDDVMGASWSSKSVSKGAYCTQVNIYSKSVEIPAGLTMKIAEKIASTTNCELTDPCKDDIYHFKKSIKSATNLKESIHAVYETCSKYDTAYNRLMKFALDGIL